MALDGFFWFPRTLLGIEPHLYAFYDQPELMHRMNDDLAEHFTARARARLRRMLTPDFMTFAEDMSYNHGPMLSREVRRVHGAVLPPHHRRCSRRRGIDVHRGHRRRHHAS